MKLRDKVDTKTPACIATGTPSPRGYVNMEYQGHAGFIA